MPAVHSDLSPEYDSDVLVIGGGPAGSTAAARLAARGHRVTLLEKARHPRFHIGESLLPNNLPLFEQLGVAGEIRAIGMEKWGVQFHSPWHAHTQAFLFADALDKTMPMSFQVRRSAFDHILLRNAARQGARVIEECEARTAAFDAAGVRVLARDADGEREFRARYLLDASGRDTFLANRFKAKQANPAHNSAALYGHFAGALRNEGRAAGDISIFWFDHGWFWFIPLADGVTSVGAVAWPYYLKTRKGRPLERFLLDTIALCPKLHARLRDATLVAPAEATGNYSYACDHTRGERYLLLGDAYTFIDPVFSSGVMFAMQSAFAGADAIDACLRQPARAPRALLEFDRVMRAGPAIFSWFIYRVTNPALRNLIMAPSNIFRVRETVLSVLAGDVYGKTRIHTRLLVFKAIYYLASLLRLPRTLMAVRARKVNIRATDDADPAIR
jgi:flavin-dependent dehydrogenase